VAEADKSRREQWAPPARPDWVSRVNAEGVGFDMKGVVPFDEDSLIRTATANTGLSDFGEDDWRAPFAALVKAFDDEADLTLMGRIMTRSDLLMFLEGRLRVEDMYKRHPEIEDETIAAPVWILGQGRTGTSILQKLLALDPANRTLNTYDALFPVAEGGGPDDPRIERAEQRMSMWKRVTPEVATIHDFGGDEPIEMIMAEAMSLQTPAWLNLMGLTPSYNAAIAATGRGPSLRYGRRVLKLIQWQNPGRRWILKSPDAMSYIPEVLKVFPDVRFVWAHRDPVRALASAVNMIGTLIWVRSDTVPPAGLFDFLTDPESSAANLSRPIDWIEDGTLPRAQLHNILYDDLMADPLAAIEKLYGQFGMALSDTARQAIKAYVEAHPREERGAHRYATGDADRISRERQCYARYQQYFGVPSEL
jgi:Sulfotransferase family